jgi:hypothetical protein
MFFTFFFFFLYDDTMLNEMMKKILKMNFIFSTQSTRNFNKLFFNLRKWWDEYWRLWDSSEQRRHLLAMNRIFVFVVWWKMKWKIKAQWCSWIFSNDDDDVFKYLILLIWVLAEKHDKEWNFPLHFVCCFLNFQYKFKLKLSCWFIPLRCHFFSISFIIFNTSKSFYKFLEAFLLKWRSFATRISGFIRK